MRTPSTLLAAFTLLAVTACGAAGPVNSGSTSTGGQPLTQGATPMQQTMYFGAQYRFDEGLIIGVSTPKSFRPSGSAYPASSRAVAFEISIRNDGDQPYQLSGLSVSATVASVAAKQVQDPTQGYSGIIDAGKDVQPGRDTQVTLAFAVPDQPTQLQLCVRPSTNSPAVAVYGGSA
ncbi:MAG TPA: hypothetical protein VJT49_19475 [Amycolatopsis sp.]|uniref:hypothetical protein n=1 Tax=Amycolatopsis sp. TaxID=37632 RepID=UPI002B4759FF|nr:hypothetical protein [Amycolatopsis sp.]HKS47246.1 hypothetical protein [Amycolatopsis sp.]